MVRGRREKQACAFYHIFNRGVEKRNIYCDDNDRQTFINVLQYVHEKYNFKIHAYCLMGNHYHLILETIDDDISRIMHDIDGIYAQIFNQKYERVGPLFQSRFGSIIVRGDYYLLNLFSYVHLNPVKDGFKYRAEDWYWSSFASYIGNRVAEKFLETSLYKEKFFHNGIENLRKYINDQAGLEWCELDDLWNVDYVSEQEFLDTEELVYRKNYNNFNFEKALTIFFKEKNFSENIIRNFRIYILNQIANINVDEIAEKIGDLKVNTIMKISQRMKNRIQNSSKYKKMFMDFMKKCPVCPRPWVDTFIQKSNS